MYMRALFADRGFKRMRNNDKSGYGEEK